MRFEVTIPRPRLRGGAGAANVVPAHSPVEVAAVMIGVVLVAAWLGRPGFGLTGDSDEPY